MSTVFSEVVFTPESAMDFLTRFGRENNRRVSRPRVVSYADIMKSGRWLSSAAMAVVVGADGRMIDGHHRLAAVAMAGVPVKMTVIYGESMEAMAWIDTGQSRTSSQVARLTGTDTSCDAPLRIIGEELRGTRGFVGPVELERLREYFRPCWGLFLTMRRARFGGNKTITAGVQAGIAMMRMKRGPAVDEFGPEITAACSRDPSAHSAAVNLVRWLENRPRASAGQVGGAQAVYIGTGAHAVDTFLKDQQSQFLRATTQNVPELVRHVRAAMGYTKDATLASWQPAANPVAPKP